MEDKTFRIAMGKFTTGVTVVTTVVDEEVYGMTANAFMSVSLNPKLVLISIDEKANMNQFVRYSGKFAISVLAENQQDLSVYFSGQMQEKKEIDFHWFDNMPTIRGSLVNVTCDVYDYYVVGDHTLYVGKVNDVCITEGNPLAFFEGKYKQIQAFAEVN